MKIIFISSTDTNVGKTFYLIKLIESLKSYGKKIHALKPLESGFNFVNSDIKKISLSLNTNKLEDVNYMTFKLASSIYEASLVEKMNFNLEGLKSFISKKIFDFRDYDYLLIEGAGGLYSPLTINYFMKDLALEFCDSIILISDCELGCINRILINYLILKQSALDIHIFVNVRNKAFVLSQRFLENYFAKIENVFFSYNYDELFAHLLKKE